MLDNITVQTIFWQAIPPAQTINYMILGYVAMWFIGLLYVFSLASRQRNIQQDIRLMRQLLEEDEEAANR